MAIHNNKQINNKLDDMTIEHMMLQYQNKLDNDKSHLEEVKKE